MKKKNKKLQLQFPETEKSIAGMKTGNIDALIFSDKKDLKIYTQETADKTYRLLIEKMHEGAVTLNHDGTILYCNSYFAKLVSRPMQKIIGNQFRNFIYESSETNFDILFEEGWKKALKEEIYIYSDDHKIIPVLISVNAISINNYFVLSIILADLTIPNKNQEKLRVRKWQLERKNVELINANRQLAFQIKEKEKRTAELSVANTDVKERDELIAHKESILAILSHDLRSPLARIISMAGYLESNFDKIDPDESKQLLHFLSVSSKEQLNMLDYLVEWARIKYAAEAFIPAKIELAGYVEKTFAVYKETAIANRINLQNKIEKKARVFADGKMLISVLQNLVSNALKHTPPDGSITVTSKTKEDKIIVEVKDTGRGMSKEIKERLFTPQLSKLAATRNENDGAGIGLLLVKGFLEKNAGEIWVESKEGAGSSFYFTLPVNKPAGGKVGVNKMEITGDLLLDKKQTLNT